MKNLDFSQASIWPLIDIIWFETLCETNLEWIFVISLLQSECLRYEWHASFRSFRFLQVKYTQGGLENLELSRKYFAQALKLNNRNMRALFGLYMVSMIIDFPCYHFEYVYACVSSFAICCFVFSPWFLT